MKYNWPYSGPMLCLTAEGGTSGKNSATDQRQIQATSQEGPVVGGDGQVNTGQSLSAQGNINVTDMGAVDSAFSFGSNVIAEVTKVFANTAATQAATVTANTDFLKGQTALISQNSAGGASEASNKTILYVVGAALAVVALIFFFKR